jgi:hypothetical protein
MLTLVDGFILTKSGKIVKTAKGLPGMMSNQNITGGVECIYFTIWRFVSWPHG